MKPQSGFTLVETLVAGVVSTLLAGVVLTVLKLNSDQLRISSAALRATLIQNVVSEAFHRAASQAIVVKGSFDGPTTMADPDTNDGPYEGRRTVVFCVWNDTLGGFRIRSGRFQELLGNPGSRSWQPMLVGGEAVYVDDARSNFRIHARRNGLDMNLYFRMPIPGRPDFELPSIEESVTCRNSKRF